MHPRRKHSLSAGGVGRHRAQTASGTALSSGTASALWKKKALRPILALGILTRTRTCPGSHGSGSSTPGELGPLPSTVSVLAHRATGSRVVTAPGLCHWCEPRDVPDSPDIPQWGRLPARALSGVTLAGVPRGSAMTSVLSFNSRNSLGVIRLVRFPGVLINRPVFTATRKARPCCLKGPGIKNVCASSL